MNLKEQDKYICNECKMKLWVDMNGYGFWCKKCDKPGGENVTVTYSHRVITRAEVPEQVVDNENDDEIADYIYNWICADEDIEIMSY